MTFSYNRIFRYVFKKKPDFNHQIYNLKVRIDFEFIINQMRFDCRKS